MDFNSDQLLAAKLWLSQQQINRLNDTQDKSVYCLCPMMNQPLATVIEAYNKAYTWLQNTDASTVTIISLFHIWICHSIAFKITTVNKTQWDNSKSHKRDCNICRGLKDGGTVRILSMQHQTLSRTVDNFNFSKCENVTVQ